MQQLPAEGGVRHLGVELHGVEAFRCILHRGARTVGRFGDDRKALGRLGDVVGVAHPDDAVGRYARKKRAFPGYVQINLAVFRHRRGLDPAAAHPRHQLTAVADAEHRHAEVEDVLRIVRGGRVVNGIRPARKNNALVALLADFRKVRGVGEDFRIDVRVAHAPGDELVILPAEIQNQNFFHAAASFRLAVGILYL